MGIRRSTLSVRIPMMLARRDGRKVILAPDGMQVRLRAEGLQTLVEELRSRKAKAA